MGLDDKTIDPLFDDAVEYLITNEYASINDVKEYFGIGYNRAALLLQQMEEMQIVTWEHNNGASRYKIITPLTKKATRQEKKEPITSPSVANTKKSDSKVLGYGGFEWLMAGIGFIAIIVVFVSCSSRTPAPATDYCTDDKTAYIYAEKLISSHLKAPSTAKFASYYDVKSYKPEECKFNFIGHVDAQNSFGAMIRTKFNVIVRYEPKSDKYYLENLDM
ncbi:DNA translocase FtsK [Xenorhabdus sp. KJ12.1]|uniref:DNA translocase FtsK n=1 Tax=Xenorhabdus sp. KJ12.1 TaxID=1851571 RepID=UPI000C0424F2|nr:DNA translocase FtsK [Xenorhabdus sp. KJ12.1]PHM66725.1 cell division protein FtsK [Xenorhabdus sp. KJ12.1]